MQNGTVKTSIQMPMNTAATTDLIITPIEALAAWKRDNEMSSANQEVEYIT